jgi:hypothetical protein
MIRWLALFALNLVVLVVAPIAVALLLPFAYSGDRFNILRPWALWLNTPDDPGSDQGMYEPAVAQVAARFGWWAKTWYWLGWRNQCYGLFAALCACYDGSPVAERRWGPLKVYSIPGFAELTWPGRRVSLGYKVHTLKTATLGAPVWWVCMLAPWKPREY